MSDISKSEAFQQSAILFLAGEMPLAERAAFSQRLTTDSVAAAEFTQVESAWIGAHVAIEHADRAVSLAASADAGARWFGRRVAQWHVDRLAPTKVASPGKSAKNLPIWTWPLAAAAVVVLGLGIWTLMPDTPGTLISPLPGAGMGEFPVAMIDAREELWADLAQTVDPSLGLADLENQAAALSVLRDEPAANAP